MAETLVAPSTGTTKNSGQNLLSHIKSTADSMEKGDILGSVSGVANVAMDVIGITGDPMGAISSAGVGWVLGAVSFLKEPFEVLKGSPSAITGSASSWGTAASGLTSTAGQYREAATTQTTNWLGAASDGYRAASTNQANGLDALAQASKGVSTAITSAGQAVASARKTVMDLIGEAVQKIIQICIEALSKSWLSFGASIAQGIAQSVQKAVQTGTKLVSEIQKVIQTLQKIMQVVQQITQIAQQVKQLLDTIGGKATGQTSAPQTTVQPVAYDPSALNVFQPNDMGTRPAATPLDPGQTPTAPPVLLAQAQTLPAPTGPVSQNGWPVNPPRSTRTIPGTNVRVNVADGDAGDVLMHVLGQVSTRVEDISLDSEAGERDDWGYAERNVRGSGDISNHASATAIDMNATRHVLGAQGTFTPQQSTEIRTILGEVDNVVRWGGDYTGRRDEMHFEIVGSQAEVRAVAERLRAAAPAPAQ